MQNMQFIYWNIYSVSNLHCPVFLVTQTGFPDQRTWLFIFVKQVSVIGLHTISQNKITKLIIKLI